MLIDCLNKYCSTDVTSLVLGDINCNNIKWSDLTVTSDSMQKKFLDCTIELGLCQYVTEPTRGQNTLDVVLCTDPLLVSEVSVSPPFSVSDHNSVEFLLCCMADDIDNNNGMNELSKTSVCSDLKVSVDKKKVVLWKKANWVNLENFVQNVNWASYFSDVTDSESCWDTFSQILSYGINLFVPKACSRYRYSSSGDIQNGRSKKYYSKNVKKLLSKKLSIWRKYKQCKSKQNKQKYLKISKMCKYAMDTKAKEFEKQILNSGDLGKFYKYINSKLCSKSGIGPLKDENNKYVFTASEKSNLLNKYFSSVCIKDDNLTPVSILTKSFVTDQSLDKITFTICETHKVLTKQKKSCLLAQMVFHQFYLNA